MRLSSVFLLVVGAALVAACDGDGNGPSNAAPTAAFGGEDCLRPQSLPQCMDGLIEEPAGRLAVALGPEPGHQLVAAGGPGTGGGEQGQEGEAVSLDRRAAKGAAPTLQCDTTEKLEGERHGPG